MYLSHRKAQTHRRVCVWPLYHACRGDNSEVSMTCPRLFSAVDSGYHCRTLGLYRISIRQTVCPRVVPRLPRAYRHDDLALRGGAPAQSVVPTRHSLRVLLHMSGDLLPAGIYVQARCGCTLRGSGALQNARPRRHAAPKRYLVNSSVSYPPLLRARAQR